MGKAKPLNLSAWMDGKAAKDGDVAKLLNISRVQVSRIRRGVNGASKATAHKLEKLTGIPWHEFISGGAS